MSAGRLSVRGATDKSAGCIGIPGLRPRASAGIAQGMPLLSLLVLALGAAGQPAQQILLERCVACHGPDKHKADLRLDQAASAARVIAPGKPEESELYRRLLSTDPEERMPKGKDPLPTAEIAILRDWIAAGAAWPEDGGHWAYRPLQSPTPPQVRRGAWLRNPIDAFVLERLEREGLEPQREADARTLLRRLSLDLTGLPPSPEEARAFADERDPQAYDRAVERLLASPHFGERWALPWLDLARYADTNGYEKDARRSNWLWRDWVIDALNADMPFDRFTIEQLAGDLLPEPSPSQRIATGFQRNSLVNQEGGTDPEEFRYAAVVDRTNTAATVWLGSTLGCAQCHNHKYDPFTQRDYYRLLAFFDQSADTGNAVEPVLAVPSEEQLRRQRELAQRAQGLETLLADGDAEFEAEERAWEARARSELRAPAWTQLVSQAQGAALVCQPPEGEFSLLLVEFATGFTIADLEAEFVAADGSVRPLPIVAARGERGSGARLALASPVRARAGEKLRLHPADGELRISTSDDAAAAARMLPAFDAVEGWEIAGPFAGEVPAQIEWRAETGRLRGAVRPISETQTSWLWRRRFTVNAPRRMALYLGADDELHVTLDGRVVYEGTQYDPVLKDAHRVVLELGLGDHVLELRVHNDAGPGGLYLNCFRDDFLPGEIEDALLEPPADARPLQRYFRREVSPRGRALVAQLEATHAEEAALTAAAPTTMVMAEGDAPRTTHVHLKGAFLQLGEEVTPDTPACLPPLDPAWPKNRLGLALWLVDPRNPLVARVQANRVWEQLFGRGLVATGEDLGTRGAAPTHPELLDWLACEYLGGGWSLKQLLRTIVGSATYRQAAIGDAGRLERDPLAELLSRSPRPRLQGELLRDNALAIAGLLDPQLGGPSVFPPQPDGVWAPVYSDDKWMESSGGERLRRGLYTFWRRSSPYADFMLFDAPSREACCPRRARTDTPLQALALLNDPAFVECARALGQRMQDAPGDERARLALGFERCTARRPEERELDALAQLLAAQGWTPVANVLLNLDETLCRP